MKRNIVLSVLALLVLSSFKNCGENEQLPEYVDMIFMIPITISPVQENFSINDTLTLEVVFPDTVKEFYSGKYLKLRNFDFAVIINTLKLEEAGSLYLSQVPGNSGSFRFYPQVGSINIAGSLGGYLTFMYTHSHYNLKIKIVPQTPSLNCFAFTSSYVLNHKRLDETIDLGFTKDRRRRVPILRGIFFIVNEGNNNFHLLRENSLLAMDKYPVPGNIYYERYGTFTFRVVE